MEDKKEIVERMKVLLMATRAGKDLENLILNENQSRVTLLFKNGLRRQVCIVGDSGIAIIHDVLRML